MARKGNSGSVAERCTLNIYFCSCSYLTRMMTGDSLMRRTEILSIHESGKH